jgi:hypothetical protein
MRHVLLLGLATTAACASFKSRFPSHEDVFKPIAPEIGTMRLAGSDTAWVLAGAGYQVTAGDRALLEPAKRALDEAAASWERYFGSPPPTVEATVRKYTRERADRTAPDSALASGVPVVFVAFADRRTRAGMWMGDIAIVQPVVRAWVRKTVDTSRVERPETRWFRVAMTALVGGIPEPDIVTAQLGRDTTRLFPLRAVVSGERPGGSPDTRGTFGEGRNLDEMRRRRSPRDIAIRALEGDRLWDAQAISFAHYIAAREGRPFLGSLGAALAAGETLDDAIVAAYSLPDDLGSIERGWREWVREQAAGRGGGRGDR